MPKMLSKKTEREKVNKGAVLTIAVLSVILGFVLYGYMDNMIDLIRQRVELDYSRSCFWEWQINNSCKALGGDLKPLSYENGKYWTCIKKTDNHYYSIFQVEAC